MNCPECGLNVTEDQLAKSMGQCPHCGMICRLPPSNVLKNVNPFGLNQSNPFSKNAPTTAADLAGKFQKEQPDLPAPDVPQVEPHDPETGTPLDELFTPAKVNLRQGPLDGAVATVQILKTGPHAGQWPSRISTARDADSKRKHWYARVGNTDVYKYERSE